jgi:hypothetical protein
VRYYPIKPDFIKTQNIGEEDIQRFVANIVMDEETLLRRYGYAREAMSRVEEEQLSEP